MTILLKIQTLIDQLSDSTQDIDIDNIKNVLSLAYEVSRDGLERSQNATELKKMKDLLSSNSIELTEIKKKYKNLLEKHSQFKILSPFFENLKNKLIGKVNLISSYDKSYKESLTKEINSVTPDNVISIFNRIENDFNKNWSKETKSKISSKNNINLKNYKIGGGNAFANR